MQINDACVLPAVHLVRLVEWNGRVDLMAGGRPLDILVKAAVD